MVLGMQAVACLQSRIFIRTLAEGSTPVIIAINKNTSKDGTLLPVVSIISIVTTTTTATTLRVCRSSSSKGPPLELRDAVLPPSFHLAAPLQQAHAQPAVGYCRIFSICTKADLSAHIILSSACGHPKSTQELKAAVANAPRGEREVILLKVQAPTMQASSSPSLQHEAKDAQCCYLLSQVASSRCGSCPEESIARCR